MRSDEYRFDNVPNASVRSSELRRDKTRVQGGTMGYPSWCLLYYSLLCGVPKRAKLNVLETGTCFGYSTLILLQALKDNDSPGTVHTVEIDEKKFKSASTNIRTSFPMFRPEYRTYCGRGVDVLASFDEPIDFLFLDGDHRTQAVIDEFEAALPRLVGKVYFDNSGPGTPVRAAINRIVSMHGGQVVHFDHCSWCPPGNSIWEKNE